MSYSSKKRRSNIAVASTVSETNTDEEDYSNEESEYENNCIYIINKDKKNEKKCNKSIYRGEFCKEHSKQLMKKNIFRRKGSGYSSLDPRKVLDYLKIDLSLFGSNSLFNNIGLDLNLNDDLQDDIAKQLIRVTKAIGHVDWGSEARRQEFVSPIILSLISEYSDSGIKMDIQGTVKGEEVSGKVEYVTVKGVIILFIIEAKASDFDQGRAQNLFQVYNAYKSNLTKGMPKDHTVYGCVTTGYDWEFISCKGVNDSDNIVWCHKSRINPIETDVNAPKDVWKNKLRPLLIILCKILDEYKSLDITKLKPIKH